MKRYLLVLALSVFCNALNAQNLNLIPYPQQVTTLKTTLRMKPGSLFFTNNSRYKNDVVYLNNQLGLTGKGGQEISILVNADVNNPGGF